MAKYIVTAKRSDAKGAIQSLRVHKVDEVKNKWNPDAWEDKTRTQVVTSIRAKDTYQTWVLVGGQWKAGAEIKEWPVTVHYLKTVEDKETRDNLDNLPNF